MPSSRWRSHGGSQLLGAALRRFSRGTEAVTDVIGNILIVAITVAMMSGLALLVVNQPGPTNMEHADLAISLAKGDGTWGNGNEKVHVDHLGGEALERVDIVIILRQGATTTEYADTLLDGGFADGRYTTGENWNATLTIAANSVVDVDILAERSRLVATASLSSVQSCVTDGLAPSLSLSTQRPADVRITTLGAVTVDATFIDDCTGVDTATAPHLWSTIDDGTPPDEAFVDRGAMVLQSGTTWRGTVPDPTWAIQGGKSLKWYVTGQRDLAGNTGTTGTTSDLINVLGATVFVTANDPLTGTVGNFSRMQSAADSDAEAELKEAATTPAPATLTFTTDALVTSGTGWSGTVADLATSDDVRATNSHNNPGVLEVGHANPAPPTGTITAVVLKAEVSITTVTDDRFTIQACLAAVCSAASPQDGGSASDVTMTYDVTALRPGGGSWGWTDISNLQDRITPVKNGGGRDGTWRVDRAWVEVTYQPPTVYSMNVELTFDGVIAGTHYLDLQYRKTGTDTFQLQVWDWIASAWNTRATLDSSTATNVTYLLTSNEFAGVNPSVKVRVVDAAPGDASQARAYFDWARVITA